MNNKNIEREIEKIYRRVLKKILTNEIINSVMEGDMNKMDLKIYNLTSSNAYNRFAEEFSKELTKKGLSNKRGMWRKYYKAAKKLHHVAIPSTFKEFEIQNFKEIVNSNFDLIKSIPTIIFNTYRQKGVQNLVKEVAEGKKSRGEFEKFLKMHGAKNAKLIARTETAKLQTAISETRSRALGSVAYIWKSTKDQRTRLSHKKMNDVVVFWKDSGRKPLLDKMRGNAGEFPNCRCDINEIFDEYDLRNLGNTVKVYDYRYDKIITMSKKELLNCLKKGELD